MGNQYSSYLSICVLNIRRAMTKQTLIDSTSGEMNFDLLAHVLNMGFHQALQFLNLLIDRDKSQNMKFWTCLQKSMVDYWEERSGEWSELLMCVQFRMTNVIGSVREHKSFWNFSSTQMTVLMVIFAFYFNLNMSKEGCMQLEIFMQSTKSVVDFVE